MTVFGDSVVFELDEPIVYAVLSVFRPAVSQDDSCHWKVRLFVSDIHCEDVDSLVLVLQVQLREDHALVRQIGNSSNPPLHC